MAGKSGRSVTITKRTVDALAMPATGEAWLWDDRLTGFGVRARNGSKTYLLQYRNAAGRSRKFTIGKHGVITPAEASEIARELLARIRLGADPAEERQDRRQSLTVTELATLYLADGPASRPDKKPSSWARDRSAINRHILPLLGRKDARTLTKADIERWQADVAMGKTAADVKTGFRGRAIVEGGKGAAARALATLSSMLAWATDRGILKGNPARGVLTFKGEKRERFLSIDEVARLGQALAAMVAERALNPRAADAIRLLLLTGCRKSEILTLRWAHVSTESRRITLPDSKTGARIVTLPDAAINLLATIPKEIGSPYVFPAHRGAGHLTLPYKDWQRVAKRAGLEGVRIHDLRHSFASAAVAGGASLYLTAKLLGHKQSRTTERYAHFADDPIRAAANAVADLLNAALCNRNPGQTD